MFEFLFFVTAVYMAYVAYEAYQAVGRAEKGEPVFKPRPAAPQKATVAPVAAAKTAAPAPVAAKAAPKAVVPGAKPAPATKTKATAKASEKPPAKTPATKAPAAKAAPAKPAAASAPVSAEPVKLTDEFRNPATGEVSPVPANYRFAKKWIKDALVSEKLLDRVYKPNELDDAASKKVKEAIEKLRAIKKYHA